MKQTLAAALLAFAVLVLAANTANAGGLEDLMGSNYLNSKKPHSWKPNMTWFDNEKSHLDQLFPECQHEFWCDTFFNPAESEEVAELLWKVQNPEDCNTAKLAILQDTWPSGVGSALHVFGMGLQMALTQGRALVTNNAAWAVYGGHSPCPSDNTFSCYFLPTSHCSPPAGSFPGFNPSDPSPRVVMLSTGMHQKCGAATFEGAKDNPLSKFNHKRFEWWFPHIMRYVLRPQQWLLKEWVWPIQHAVFYKTEGVIPHPLAAIFVRRGDKGSEAALHAFEEYFEKLEPIATKLNLKHVYVNSDDFSQIEGAIQKYSDKYEIHFMDYHRFGGGLSFGHVTSMSRMLMQRHLRMSFADLYISVQADVLAGTLSSNWCRLQDELRKTMGKSRIPYVPIDGFAMCC